MNDRMNTRWIQRFSNFKKALSQLEKFIKCAVKPRRLGRGYKAQSFKAGFVVEYIV